jgi:uncharacterized repeat protein (TIGR03803 family)
MKKQLAGWTGGAMMCALLLSAASVQAQFNLLHEFTGVAGDGSTPYYTAPTVSGTTLYGMTYQGGASGLGTVFQMNTDGTGFSLLHSFAGGGSDGRNPYGSLTLSGATLYGMTRTGGDSGLGTVFKMNTDGTGFSLLHEFAGGGTDGSVPYGALTLDGGTLYGMTYQGGDANRGTVFKINTDGTGFSLLREFAGGTTDGFYPYGALTLSGATLYGMTYLGGASSAGTLFQMNTDGTGFRLLHSFAGGASDGSNPRGSLLFSGATFYGMTQQGGDSGLGTVFQMNTDGSGYSLLHEFAGGASDGSNPYADLTLSGTTLYGMTRYGGDSSAGTMFQMNSDGTGFSLIHEFAGGASDGSNPWGSLTLSSATLYGMTYQGGDSNLGTVFSYVVPEPSTFTLAAAGLAALLMRRRK